MNPVRVVETFKLIEKYNKISGHHWTEQGDSTGDEVWGGTTLSPRKRFKTLAAAKKGAEAEDYQHLLDYEGIFEISLKAEKIR